MVAKRRVGFDFLPELVPLEILGVVLHCLSSSAHVGVFCVFWARMEVLEGDRRTTVQGSLGCKPVKSSRGSFVKFLSKFKSNSNSMKI